MTQDTLTRLWNQILRIIFDVDSVKDCVYEITPGMYIMKVALDDGKVFEEKIVKE